MKSSQDAIITSLQARLSRIEVAERRSAERMRLVKRCARAAALLVIVTIPVVATAVDLPHVFVAGEPIVATELNESVEALAAAIDARVIATDTVIAIDPAQGCTGVQEALDALDARDIVGAATVTLELAPGVYACDASVFVRHPAGDRIRIRGGGNAPEEVTLTFPPETSGVVVGAGRTLGGLENLTLDGGSGGGAGLDVKDGAVVLVDEIVVREFGHGLLVTRSSVFGTGVLATQNGSWGIMAIGSSSIDLEDVPLPGGVVPPDRM